MARIAIVRPTTLLGQEIRSALDERRDLWTELRLFSNREDEVGVLSEVRGGAALVEALDEHSFDPVELVILCGSTDEHRDWLERVPPGLQVLVATPDASVDEGYPVVAGVNLEMAEGVSPVVSPHPGAILLSHLLAPLGELGLRDVVATLLEPISMHERAALDEVLEDTRNFLGFQPRTASESFGAQMAFNLLPSPTDPSRLVEVLRRTLGGEDLALSVQAAQASVFHAVTASLHVRLAEGIDEATVREALTSMSIFDFAPDPHLLGPIDAPNRQEILLGSITPTQTGFWLWAVMDNLTVGGAHNVVRLAERMLATPAAS